MARLAVASNGVLLRPVGYQDTCVDVDVASVPFLINFDPSCCNSHPMKSSRCMHSINSDFSLRT